MGSGNVGGKEGKEDRVAEKGYTEQRGKKDCVCSEAK